MRMRQELGWTQLDLATKLGISRRTLSHWESGHWFPPHKERLHVVLSLHDVPPEHVLEIADGLGVTLNPRVEPLLKPFRDALYGTEETPPPPPAEPPRPRPTPEQLRAAVDVVLRDASDGMNVLTNDLRAAIGRALAASAELGGTLEDTREAVAVKPKAAKR
jgi:transcriptional regulator with XRE-family HTH domain